MKRYLVSLYACSWEFEGKPCVKMCKKINMCSYENEIGRSCDEGTFKMQKLVDITDNICVRLAYLY